jgi:exonuclease VII large subunit
MFTGIAIFSVISLIRMEKESKIRDDQYHILEDSIFIKGDISSLFSEHGHVYITFKDSTKYLVAHSTNYKYSPFFLNEFLHVGDSLYKNTGSDTLFINRAMDHYYFIIGKSIGEDPTPKVFGKNKK